MNKRPMMFHGVREALFSAFPEIWPRVESTFGSYYDLKKGTPEETPEAYPIFEDVVQKLLFELLDDGKSEALLARLFHFFEDMANSPDLSISRDLLGIAILEPLVARGESIRQAWKYMGPRTKELAKSEAREQGRRENLPST